MKSNVISKRTVHAGAAISISLMLAACGGGGSDATVGATAPAITPAPASSTGITANYYPVAISNLWRFNVSSATVNMPKTCSHSIINTTVYKGVNAAILQDDCFSLTGSITQNYYSKTTRAITLLGNNDRTDPVTQAVTPYDEMRFDGSFSATPLIEKTNVDLGQDLDGDRRNELVDVLATGTVEGFETLTTPAGTFANTARLKFVVVTTIKPTATGSRSVTSTATVTEWRAPNVGLVKQSTITVSGGQTETDSLELRSFSVVGQ